MHVRRAVAGDADSLAWLVQHFRGLVIAQVRLRLRGHGDAQDVDDLAAEVWSVMVMRLGDLQPREERHTPVLVRFLGSTVLGVCNNFLRRRAREAALFQRGQTADRTQSERPNPLGRLPAQTRGVVSRVLLQEQRGVVEQCLGELTEDQRDVLVLRLMEHRTNREIGALLGLPPNTIAVRYRRALESLRDRLPRELYGEFLAPARTA